MARTHSPTCPHCDYEFDDEETWYSQHSATGYVHTGDCEDSDLICPNLDCKMLFTTTCVHEIKFESSED